MMRFTQSEQFPGNQQKIGESSVRIHNTYPRGLIDNGVLASWVARGQQVEVKDVWRNPIFPTN